MVAVEVVVAPVDPELMGEVLVLAVLALVEVLVFLLVDLVLLQAVVEVVPYQTRHSVSVVLAAAEEAVVIPPILNLQTQPQVW